MKVCRLCEAQKPLESFRPHTKAHGRRSECRACENKRAREYATGYRKQNKELLRDKVLRSKYGISMADKADMLAAQDGKCAICRKPFEDNRRGAGSVVDHDHETGKVRGVLHDTCNRAIGLLGDSPEALEAAAAYLRAA